jgi:hypothetical protein
VAIAAGIAQGFNYVYFSFFACFMLLVAGGIGGVASRSYGPLFRATIIVAIICAAASANLWPSFSSWQRSGKPADMSYKRVFEAEAYGIKLRRMLLPSESNAIGPWQTGRGETERLGFQAEENEAARLGPLRRPVS